jgi:hypothetical protein
MKRRKNRESQGKKNPFHFLGNWVITALLLPAITSFMWGALHQSYFTIGNHQEIVNTQLAPNRLRVTWDGRQVPVIFAKKVALWNSSSVLIDQSTISETQPLKIVPSEPVKILGVEMAGVSQESILFKKRIERDEKLNRDVILITIAGNNALEKNDGGIFQIFYSAEKPVDFTVQARIKGLPRGFVYYPYQFFLELKKINNLYQGNLIFILAISISLSVLGKIAIERINDSLGDSLFVIGLVISVFIVLAYALGLLGGTFAPAWLVL